MSQSGSILISGYQNGQSRIEEFIHITIFQRVEHYEPKITKSSTCLKIFEHAFLRRAGPL